MSQERFEILVEKKLVIPVRIILSCITIPFFIDVFHSIMTGVVYSKRGLTEYSIEASAFDFWLFTLRDISIPVGILWVAFMVVKPRLESTKSKEQD